MLIKLIKSVNFKEEHIENHFMHLTETFAVKLLRIIVSDVSPKQVLARILLIELTKTSETISDSAVCYAGLSVRFESSAACM